MHTRFSYRSHPTRRAAIALLMGLIAGGAGAATLTVDGSSCRLSDAIDAANSDSPRGGCAAGQGFDNLVLTAPLYTVPTEDGHRGLPAITSSIYLKGERSAGGQRVVVQGEVGDRPPAGPVLVVEAAGHLVVRAVTFRNVTSDVANSVGVIRNRGTLELIHSAVINSPLGLINEGGDMKLYASVVSGNFSKYIAGIGNYDGGSLLLWQSTVSGNGGYYVDVCSGLDNAGSVTVENSTITANGGFCNSGTATVINSTISRNRHDGLRVLGGSTILRHVTIIGNDKGVGSLEGSVTVTNSLVANNNTDCDGGVELAGVNLIEDGSCEALARGSLVGRPKVGRLARNGGPTKTHALLPESPAIDAADDAVCAATDQRRRTRPQGEHCDIGAFEADAPEAQP